MQEGSLGPLIVKHGQSADVSGGGDFGGVSDELYVIDIRKSMVMVVHPCDERFRNAVRLSPSSSILLRRPSTGIPKTLTMESESHRLVHSLTAHLALYHSHVSRPNPNPTHRDSILRWFSSLSTAHRQAALTISDPSFTQIVLQMQSRLRGQGHSHFLLLPDILSSSHPSLPSLSFRPSRGLLSRSAASNSSALGLSNSILFFSSTLSGAASADAVMVSESLVTDVDCFVGIMDGLSSGRFLCEEVDILGLTVQWVELPWLKDMGYYTLEAFIANMLEVVLRLAWVSSQGGKKPKEKRLKERAAEISGKAANEFWRIKGCLGWWVGLDPGIQKKIISTFFGKSTRALASEIIKEENTLKNVFGYLNIVRNVELQYGGLSSWQKCKPAPFRRYTDSGLDFLPCRVPKNLTIIWKKLVIVHDISNILLEWQSSNSEAEKLFFRSLGSSFTVSDHITRKLQNALMVVYTNFINYELMVDTNLSVFSQKKAEEKRNFVCRKGKSRSHSSKKCNPMPKDYSTTSITPYESSKKLDCSSELCYKENTSSLVARRIIDGALSLDIKSVPKVKSLVVQKEMDNANASVSVNSMENTGKRKNRRKGAKNKCYNLKNIGKPKCEDNEGNFTPVAAEREPTGTFDYVCTSNSKPKSVDLLTYGDLLAPSFSDVSPENAMVDVPQSKQVIPEYQSPSLTEGSHSSSGKIGSDMSKYVCPCLRMSEPSLQTTCKSSTYPNKEIDTRMCTMCDPSPHTHVLDNVATEGKQESLISTVARDSASKSFVSKECLKAASDERRSVMHNVCSEFYTYGGVDSMQGISYEWPSITPPHFPYINSHFLPATDRLHLDVGVSFPYRNQMPSVPSKTHAGNSLSESGHRQILHSLAYPISYDCPPMVKNCSRLSQTHTFSYESTYSQNIPSSLCSRLASCATHGVQVNVASGDNEVKHAGDIIDVYDLKNVSELVEDESYWLSEEESEPHARSGRDYNKFFGGGVMYWNPTELVGIGFSRPPSHSSEDSSWAWHEADLNRTIDDMVGCKSGLPTYNTNGRASPPSSYCSPFDNLASGHPSVVYTVAGSDGSCTAIHSPSVSYSSDEKNSSSTANSAACIEGLKGDPSPYPILRPIIIPGMSRKGSRSDLKLGHDNKSPCLASARRDNPRIRRPPSPVVLCVPQIPRPPPSSTVGESRKRGFPTVRSGSSSPRHWGVKSWFHEENSVADTHLCLDGAEVVWPTWARKGLRVAAVAQSLQGSLLQDHLITISQLAHDQEHPDAALPLQPPDLLNGSWKGSLSILQNLLHEEIDFFCKKVAAENLIRKPYINWAVRRVTRSLQEPIKEAGILKGVMVLRKLSAATKSIICTSTVCVDVIGKGAALCTKHPAHRGSGNGPTTTVKCGQTLPDIFAKGCFQDSNPVASRSHGNTSTGVPRLPIKE
ncbi:hypothetical protein KSP40_PGU017848 [Platanthera guangdongensis]|uniref:Uncharacterized protein n=1 Tax=Platanthera guangdongensis TaxID=2320717 RepID=A0ABR2N3J4_9ASPA